MQDASELGEQKDMCLSISEVSELTGITPSNLRFLKKKESWTSRETGRDAVSSTARKWKNFWGWFALSILDWNSRRSNAFFTWFAKVIRHCANVTAC